MRSNGHLWARWGSNRRKSTTGSPADPGDRLADPSRLHARSADSRRL